MGATSLSARKPSARWVKSFLDGEGLTGHFVASFCLRIQCDAGSGRAPGRISFLPHSKRYAGQGALGGEMVRSKLLGGLGIAGVDLRQDAGHVGHARNSAVLGR